MTWKEFKDAVEEKGLRDCEEISRVDWHGTRSPRVNRFRDGSIEVSTLIQFEITDPALGTPGRYSLDT